MPHFRTLTGRFGTLYAFILLVVTGVCAVVWVQSLQIRSDSARVMEETRELQVLVRVRASLNAALECLEDKTCTGKEGRARLERIIQPTARELERMRGGDHDPSLLDHQAAEESLLVDVIESLRSLEAILSEGEDDLDEEPFASILASAAHGVEVMAHETLDEAKDADLDLQVRTTSVRTVMLVTVIVALLLLSAALMAVHIAVVSPLKVLRDGAEKYAKGRLEHRIRLRNRDELGDLAHTLNGMARNLFDVREHLEDRVRTRTREFIRAARLVDLGILASGVAHEVNTPLASIASCAEGLQRRIKSEDLSPELLEDYIGTIVREVYRARSITSRMLALVRQEGRSLADVSLQLILDQGHSALGHKADTAKVQLEFVPPKRDLSIHVESGELVQILVNLLANAIDVSPPGGVVSLRVEEAPGLFSLVVEDSGPGIPEENLDRILEPFFTTKGSDGGTGLGLALVNSLVSSHSGTISIENRDSGGARFKVTLPMDWRIDA